MQYQHSQPNRKSSPTSEPEALPAQAIALPSFSTPGGSIWVANEWVNSDSIGLIRGHRLQSFAEIRLRNPSD
jgi:hypothetical protein